MWICAPPSSTMRRASAAYSSGRVGDRRALVAVGDRAADRAAEDHGVFEAAHGRRPSGCGLASRAEGRTCTRRLVVVSRRPGGDLNAVVVPRQARATLQRGPPCGADAPTCALARSARRRSSSPRCRAAATVRRLTERRQALRSAGRGAPGTVGRAVLPTCRTGRVVTCRARARGDRAVDSVRLPKRWSTATRMGCDRRSAADGREALLTGRGDLAPTCARGCAVAPSPARRHADLASLVGGAAEDVTLRVGTVPACGSA